MNTLGKLFKLLLWFLLLVFVASFSNRIDQRDKAARDSSSQTQPTACLPPDPCDAAGAASQRVASQVTTTPYLVSFTGVEALAGP